MTVASDPFVTTSADRLPGSPAQPARGMVTAPNSLAAIASAVEGRIRTLLDCELERWTAVDADLTAPLQSLADLVLSGGKRLRPAFCHWAFVGAGGDPEDRVLLDVNAGLELLHTFALIHDDVMDASRTRRGAETVHVQFMGEHRRQGWRGEDRRFGEGVAILVGDLAFVYADLLFKDANPIAAALFTEQRIEVNIGQYLDLIGTVRGRPSVDTAKRICRYKSGKYTIERPLHLGVALADRLGEFETALTRFGLPLGEAFQLRDDLLGALGDATLTRKPVGDDLREGKPTALFARALDAADGAQHKVLARIGDPDLDDAAIAGIQDVLRTTGAADLIEAQIADLREQAVTAIEQSGLTDDAVDALVHLAHFVTDREY